MLTERIRRIFSAILSPHFLGKEQEALVKMAGASLDEAQDMIDDGIEGVQAQIDDLRSEYGAGLIGIEDQDGHFTSTNVEGALKELAERDISEEDVVVTGNWSFHSPITFVDGPYGGSLGASLSDDRAYTLPDASGTIALLDDIPPQVNLIAGSNINISGTYPNLTISGTGGDGGTGVSTVNGMVGDVVLDYSDVGAAPTSHTHTIAQVTGLQTALDGKASSSHTHSASDITSGVLSTARLGTGTANSSRFLRGDGTWAEPPSGGGGGGGTVTSVNVSGGTGISATGGPITSSGTISLALSTNLQGWSGISPSSKANTSALNAKTNASDFTYVGNKSGGSYDSHFGSGSNFAYLWHAAGSQPSDAPFSPARQATVLHMGNSWGRVQLAISNEPEPQVYVRGAEESSWTTVWTSGNFDPTAQPASNITSGSFHANRIPNLPASKITSGTFSTARIPNLSSSYVATSGNQTGIGGNKTFTGNITAANLTATSDARLKEEIEEMKARQELLSALTYYRYKWKDSGNRAVGILAQEVQSIAPELVFENEEGSLSVDKAGLALEMMFAMIDKLEAIDGSSD